MSDQPRSTSNQPSVFTVERAAWVAVGLLAAGLRLLQLGLSPLSESEAVQALAAYRFTQGAAQAAPTGTDPLLFTGNVVGFSLVGASDLSARLLPALAGLIMVLLPYGLRHRLGRGGALAAALLLALSPSAIYFSRTVDSTIIVATCGLAAAVGLVDYVDRRRPAALYMVAAALGLGLAAGHGTFSLWLIFGAFALLLYLAAQLPDRAPRGTAAGWAAVTEAAQALREDEGPQPRSKGTIAAVVLAVTFGLAATTLALHPAGIGHAADLIGAWAQSFLPQRAGLGSQPAIYPLLLLLRYEPLILLLSLVEIGWVALGRGRRVGCEGCTAFPHTAFLAFWALAATAVIVISGHRPAGNILLVLVPLALLAGQGIERAWQWISERDLWPRAILVAAAGMGLLVFFYLQVAAYSQASPDSALKIADVALYTTSTYLLLAALALLLLLGLGVAVWFWRGRELVVAGGWLLIVTALGLYGFKAGWQLNFAHATDPRELMIVQATSPEVRELVTQLETLSVTEAGDAHTLAITRDSATGPVVAWYLREFPRQAVVDNLSTPPDTVAAVTLAMQDPPIGETFRGRGFALRSHWLPWGRWGQDLARWLLYTAGDLPVVDQEVVLWVATERPSGTP